MALTQEQINTLIAGGSVDFGLPVDPGPVGADGIFWESFRFDSGLLSQDDLMQGLLNLETDGDIRDQGSPSSNFIVRNADLTVGDDLGINNGSSNAIISISGELSNVLLPGLGSDGSSDLRIAAHQGGSTDGVIYVTDGATVTVDNIDPALSSRINIGVSWSYLNSDGTLAPGGQSVDGAMIIHGENTSVTVTHSANPNNGGIGAGRIDPAPDGFVDPTVGRTADGLIVVSGGAKLDVHQSAIFGDANSVEGASAQGTFLVEGLGTQVTLGNEERTGFGGFIRLGEEGGTGNLVLRDGAEIFMRSGGEFGAGLQLSGGSERDGGFATAAITGNGTRLAGESGDFSVGRNGGEAHFRASDGALVESLFFTSGHSGVGNTIFEGEGTELVLSGEQVTPEFGAFLTVGRDADGTFTVRDGADVSIIGAGDNSAFPGFQVGRNDGGVGVLTVTGEGSTLTVDGSAITDGVEGETGFMRAGRDAGSDGTINVLDGGQIANDPNGLFIVAQNDDSTGRVTVDGAGSLIDFGATMNISEDVFQARGNGIVTISNGGVLRGDQVVNNGILDITSGGILEANLLQENILRSSSGVETVMIDGSYSLAGSGAIAIDAEVDNIGSVNHDKYEVTGDVNLAGDLFIIGTSLSDLRGFSIDLMSGANITTADDLVVRFIEYDGNTIMEVDEAGLIAAEATELTFRTEGNEFIVDFGEAPPPPPAPQAPTTLDNGSSNINIDGAVNNFIDFGGEDTFTILPSISSDVQIVDNNATTILLPAGMQIDGARFLADGLQFDINGNTLTLLGSPADFSFVFAGTPLDPTAGSTLTFEQTAAEFGASIPELGEAAVEATVLGVISALGEIDAI